MEVHLILVCLVAQERKQSIGLVRQKCASGSTLGRGEHLLELLNCGKG
jgi:hypothetical protein